MRNLVLLIIFIASLALGNISYGGEYYSDSIQPTKGGDYWPWGKEVEFPWNSIQGVWVAKSFGRGSTYFSFQVQTVARTPVLKIMHFNRFSCALLAKGIGREAQRIVIAKMKGQKYHSNIEIHFFKESDVIGSDDNEASFENNDKIMAVITMDPIGKSGKSTTLDITKISSDPNDICR